MTDPVMLAVGGGPLAPDETPKRVSINGKWFETGAPCQILDVKRRWEPRDEIIILIAIPADCVDLSGTNTLEEAARAIMEQVEIKALRKEVPR